MKRTILRFVALALPFFLAPASRADSEIAMRANAHVAGANYWRAHYTPTQLKKEALSLNSDYVGETKKPSRWRRDKLKVFIDFSPVGKLKWFNQKLAELKVHQCMENWNEAVDDKFKFTIVSNKSGADIIVKFDTWRHNMRPGYAGVTSVDTWQGSDEIISAAAAIFVFDAKGHPYDEYDQEHIIYHEFGHALGLDHSANDGDIMYYAGRVASLSVRDRNTIRKLYGFSPVPFGS
jgi:hypothetical protein